MYNNTTINTKKNLKPGLVASYDIRPGNGEGLFWFRRFINLSLQQHTPDECTALDWVAVSTDTFAHSFLSKQLSSEMLIKYQYGLITKYGPKTILFTSHATVLQSFENLDNRSLKEEKTSAKPTSNEDQSWSNITDNYRHDGQDDGPAGGRGRFIGHSTSLNSLRSRVECLCVRHDAEVLTRCRAVYKYTISTLQDIIITRCRCYFQLMAVFSR